MKSLAGQNVKHTYLAVELWIEEKISAFLCGLGGCLDLDSGPDPCGGTEVEEHRQEESGRHGKM